MQNLVTSMAMRFTLLAAAFLLLLPVNNVFAQAEEIVIEPGFGTINDAIQGDTLADGSRRNPEAVYVLQRNGRYLTNGRLRQTDDYKLILKAAEGEGAPPIVQPGVRDDGTADNPLMALDGDFELHGLWLLNQSDGGAENSNGIALGTEGATGLINECIFEVARWLGVRVNTAGVTLRVTNSVIRNLIRIDDPGNGKFLDPRGTNPELFYLENNTFYNMTSEIVRESGALINNFFFNHNTVYNVGALSRNDARVNESRIVNGTVTNNLFINLAPLGDVTTNWDYFGGIVDGREDVGALFPLDSLLADDLGVAETDRDIRIDNNNIYWAPELLDYFTGLDTVQVYSTLSPLGQQQVTEGLVSYDNNIEEDPGFTNAPDVQGAIDYSIAWYTTNCGTDPPDDGCDFRTGAAEWDPLVSVPASPWPLPEDFTYPTTAASYTAGTGGYPLGDLNWFPDQKTAWEAEGGGSGMVVSTEDAADLPKDFVLHGNFPNPFNPTTTLLFDLNAPAEVSVKVYDILGRNVLTIPARAMQAGAQQSFQLDASELASGIYMYQFEAKTATDEITQMGKMILLK